MEPIQCNGNTVHNVYNICEASDVDDPTDAEEELTDNFVMSTLSSAVRGIKLAGLDCFDSEKEDELNLKPFLEQKRRKNKIRNKFIHYSCGSECCGADLCPLFENAPSQLNMASEVEFEWRTFTSVVDSGAAESVTTEKDMPFVQTTASPGSRNGVTYTAADGAVIPNEGQKEVTHYTNEGDECKSLYQVAEISRTLTAVSKICDAGNKVVFQSNGGYIQNLQTNKKTWFDRNHNVYELTTWIWAPKVPSNGGVDASSFTRPSGK